MNVESTEKPRSIGQLHEIEDILVSLECSVKSIPVMFCLVSNERRYAFHADIGSQTEQATQIGLQNVYHEPFQPVSIVLRFLTKRKVVELSIPSRAKLDIFNRKVK